MAIISNMAAQNLNHCPKVSVSEKNKIEEMNQMFSRIINEADVYIKSQQRTETDLTNEQKLQILKEIFEQSPCVFLTRFGQWISVDDLRCFCAPSGSEMEYAISVLKTNLMAKKSGVSVKNRRYEALLRLEKESSYFSDEEMRERCPLLYEQYIGQYMTDEEKFAQDEEKMKDEVKMSTFIFQQIDHDWLKQKETEEREMEECMEEEEEDDSDGDCGANEGHDEDTGGHDVTNISFEDKQRLRNEFLNIMRHRFLEGLDEDFDYTDVDKNNEYDNLDILRQDAEDKYFDEEEPEIVEKDVINEVVCSNNEAMSSTSEEEEDYLSDKILEKCCSTKR